MVWTPRSKLLIPGIAALLALSACGADKEPESARDTTPTTVTPTTATTTAAPTDGSCAYNADGMPVTKQIDPPPAQPAQSGRVKAAITTNAGIFNVTLDAANAPCTVNSFVSLSEQGFYDDTSCHRLTTEGIFVLQCGDPTGTGMGGPGYQYADELKGTETYGPGTLAMANSGPDTNGSQFFLVYGDSPLEPNYTVFGQLDTKSVQAIKKIAEAGTQTGAPDGPPKQRVKISQITVG
ncbi:MAG: peptidylprolyl isomerase [Nocardioides sp.]|jgi:peptidyl-prolyl cis-trans isomerase B (cyclophilin B)